MGGGALELAPFVYFSLPLELEARASKYVYFVVGSYGCAMEYVL